MTHDEPDRLPQAGPAQNQAGPLRALAFDLDGTLVDSAPDIALALNEALRRSGLPRFDLDRVRAWIGDGPDKLIERALAAARTPAVTELRAALRLAFDQATLQAPLAQGMVYEGIAALLAKLQPAWPMVVVTNKPTRLARAVLEAADLLPRLHAVYGADETALRKPAPLLLQRAAAELGLPAAQLLMVGDSAADMGAASAAGSPAAWAGWGYGDLRLLAQTPRWRLERPQDLLVLLRRAA